MPRHFRRLFDAYFEAHIEQGPILKDNGLPVGVVTGGQTLCWLDVQVAGVFELGAEHVHHTV